MTECTLIKFAGVGKLRKVPINILGCEAALQRDLAKLEEAARVVMKFIRNECQVLPW